MKNIIFFSFRSALKRPSGGKCLKLTVLRVIKKDKMKFDEEH